MDHFFRVFCDYYHYFYRPVGDFGVGADAVRLVRWNFWLDAYYGRGARGVLQGAERVTFFRGAFGNVGPVGVTVWFLAYHLFGVFGIFWTVGGVRLAFFGGIGFLGDAVGFIFRGER